MREYRGKMTEKLSMYKPVQFRRVPGG